MENPQNREYMWIRFHLARIIHKLWINKNIMLNWETFVHNLKYINTKMRHYDRVIKYINKAQKVNISLYSYYSLSTDVVFGFGWGENTLALAKTKKKDEGERFH